MATNVKHTERCLQHEYCYFIFHISNPNNGQAKLNIDNKKLTDILLQKGAFTYTYDLTSNPTQIGRSGFSSCRMEHENHIFVSPKDKTLILIKFLLALTKDNNDLDIFEAPDKNSGLLFEDMEVAHCVARFNADPLTNKKEFDRLRNKFLTEISTKCFFKADTLSEWIPIKNQFSC